MNLDIATKVILAFSMPFQLLGKISLLLMYEFMEDLYTLSLSTCHLCTKVSHWLNGEVV